MDQNALLALLASNQQLKENIDELAAAELETWPEEEDENHSGNSTDRFNLSSSRTKESARGPISPTVGMYEKTAVVVTSPRMPDVVVINSSAEMGYIPATPEAVRHNYKSFSSPVYDGKHFTKKVYKDRAWRRHDSPKRRGRKQSKKPLTSRQLSIARKVHALEPIVTPKELAGMFKLHENEHLHKLMKRFDR
jgi:hypothetical protein